MSRGKILGERYKIGEKIGAGAFGNVYFCVDLATPAHHHTAVAAAVNTPSGNGEQQQQQWASALRGAAAGGHQSADCVLGHGVYYNTPSTSARVKSSAAGGGGAQQPQGVPQHYTAVGALLEAHHIPNPVTALASLLSPSQHLIGGGGDNGAGAAGGGPLRSLFQHHSSNEAPLNANDENNLEFDEQQQQQPLMHSVSEIDPKILEHLLTTGSVPSNVLAELYAAQRAEAFRRHVKERRARREVRRRIAHFDRHDMYAMMGDEEEAAGGGNGSDDDDDYNSDKTNTSASDDSSFAGGGGGNDDGVAGGEDEDDESSDDGGPSPPHSPSGAAAVGDANINYDEVTFDNSDDDEAEGANNARAAPAGKPPKPQQKAATTGKGAKKARHHHHHRVAGEEWYDGPEDIPLRPLFVPRVYAVKVLSKPKLRAAEGMEAAFEREVDAMKLVSEQQCRHVINLVDVLQSSRNYYVVMDIADQGNLLQVVVRAASGGKDANDKGLTAPTTRKYFRQILVGMRTIHGCDIAHRDIKPENLLIDKWREIKISDFGFAAYSPAGRMLTRCCGTPQYTAPEIIAEEPCYDGRAADMWSVGVTLYLMAFGALPFTDPCRERLFDKIRAGHYSIPTGLRRPPAPSLLHLLSVLLDTNPNTRWSVAMVGRHPWVHGLDGLPASLQRSHVSALKARYLRMKATAKRDGRQHQHLSSSRRSDASGSSKTPTAVSEQHSSPPNTNNTRQTTAAKLRSNRSHQRQHGGGNAVVNPLADAEEEDGDEMPPLSGSPHSDGSSQQRGPGATSRAIKGGGKKKKQRGPALGASYDAMLHRGGITNGGALGSQSSGSPPPQPTAKTAANHRSRLGASNESDGTASVSGGGDGRAVRVDSDSSRRGGDGGATRGGGGALANDSFQLRADLMALEQFEAETGLRLADAADGSVGGGAAADALGTGADFADAEAIEYIMRHTGGGRGLVSRLLGGGVGVGGSGQCLGGGGGRQRSASCPPDFGTPPSLANAIGAGVTTPPPAASNELVPLMVGLLEDGTILPDRSGRLVMAAGVSSAAELAELRALLRARQAAQHEQMLAMLAAETPNTEVAAPFTYNNNAANTLAINSATGVESLGTDVVPMHGGPTNNTTASAALNNNALNNCSTDAMRCEGSSAPHSDNGGHNGAPLSADPQQSAYNAALSVGSGGAALLCASGSVTGKNRSSGDSVGASALLMASGSNGAYAGGGGGPAASRASLVLSGAVSPANFLLHQQLQGQMHTYLSTPEATSPTPFGFGFGTGRGAVGLGPSAGTSTSLPSNGGCNGSGAPPFILHQRTLSTQQQQLQQGRAGSPGLGGAAHGSSSTPINGARSRSTPHDRLTPHQTAAGAANAKKDKQQHDIEERVQRGVFRRIGIIHVRIAIHFVAVFVILFIAGSLRVLFDVDVSRWPWPQFVRNLITKILTPPTAKRANVAAAATPATAASHAATPTAPLGLATPNIAAAAAAGSSQHMQQQGRSPHARFTTTNTATNTSTTTSRLRLSPQSAQTPRQSKPSEKESDIKSSAMPPPLALAGAPAFTGIGDAEAAADRPAPASSSGIGIRTVGLVGSAVDTNSGVVSGDVAPSAAESCTRGENGALHGAPSNALPVPSSSGGSPPNDGPNGAARQTVAGGSPDKRHHLQQPQQQAETDAAATAAAIATAMGASANSGTNAPPSAANLAATAPAPPLGATPMGGTSTSSAAGGVCLSRRSLQQHAKLTNSGHFSAAHVNPSARGGGASVTATNPTDAPPAAATTGAAHANAVHHHHHQHSPPPAHPPSAHLEEFLAQQATRAMHRLPPIPSVGELLLGQGTADFYPNAADETEEGVPFRSAPLPPLGAAGQSQGHQTTAAAGAPHRSVSANPSLPPTPFTNQTAAFPNVLPPAGHFPQTYPQGLSPAGLSSGGGGAVGWGGGSAEEAQTTATTCTTQPQFPPQRLRGSVTALGASPPLTPAVAEDSPVVQFTPARRNHHHGKSSSGGGPPGGLNLAGLGGSLYQQRRHDHSAGPSSFAGQQQHQQQHAPHHQRETVGHGAQPQLGASAGSTNLTVASFFATAAAGGGTGSAHNSNSNNNPTTTAHHRGDGRGVTLAASVADTITSMAVLRSAAHIATNPHQQQQHTGTGAGTGAGGVVSPKDAALGNTINNGGASFGSNPFLSPIPEGAAQPPAAAVSSRQFGLPSGIGIGMGSGGVPSPLGSGAAVHSESLSNNALPHPPAAAAGTHSMRPAACVGVGGSQLLHSSLSGPQQTTNPSASINNLHQHQQQQQQPFGIVGNGSNLHVHQQSNAATLRFANAEELPSPCDGLEARQRLKTGLKKVVSTYFGDADANMYSHDADLDDLMLAADEAEREKEQQLAAEEEARRAREGESAQLQHSMSSAAAGLGLQPANDAHAMSASELAT